MAKVEDDMFKTKLKGKLIAIIAQRRYMDELNI